MWSEHSDSSSPQLFTGLSRPRRRSGFKKKSQWWQQQHPHQPHQTTAAYRAGGAAEAWLSACAHTWEKTEHKQEKYTRLETEITLERQFLLSLNERRLLCLRGKTEEIKISPVWHWEHIKNNFTHSPHCLWNADTRQYQKWHLIPTSHQQVHTWMERCRVPNREELRKEKAYTFLLKLNFSVCVNQWYIYEPSRCTKFQFFTQEKNYVSGTYFHLSDWIFFIV